MAAGNYDLLLERGATYQRAFIRYSREPDGSRGPVTDLTGYQARMMIREKYSSPTPILSLTEGAGLTVVGVEGKVLLTITAVQTTAITQSQGVYDLELFNLAGVVIRFLQGRVRISPEATRA